MQLAAFQDAFAAALLADPADFDAPGTGTPAALARLVRQPGFAVYRNTVMKACIDALQANFPAVERLVGEEWFRAAAAVFVRAHLPEQPSLLLYGAAFPDFLERFEPAAQVPYLAAVARIDRWWTEAHAAADAEPLDPGGLAALAREAMQVTRLVPHPAARWGWDAEWPMASLWRMQRERGDGAAIDWQGEGVLITRPHGPVHVAPLARGGVALLDACASGRTVEEAAAGALAAEPGLDLAGLIHRLLDAGAFTSLQPVPNPPESA